MFFLGRGMSLVREATALGHSLFAIAVLTAILGGSSVADAGVMFRAAWDSPFEDPVPVDLASGSVSTSAPAQSEPSTERDDAALPENGPLQVLCVPVGDAGAGSAPGSQAPTFTGAVIADMPVAASAVPHVYRQWREQSLRLPEPLCGELMDPPKVCA